MKVVTLVCLLKNLVYSRPHATANPPPPPPPPPHTPTHPLLKQGICFYPSSACRRFTVFKILILQEYVPHPSGCGGRRGAGEAGLEGRPGPQCHHLPPPGWHLAATRAAPGGLTFAATFCSTLAHPGTMPWATNPGDATNMEANFRKPCCPLFPAGQSSTHCQDFVFALLCGLAFKLCKACA